MSTLPAFSKLAEIAKKLNLESDNVSEVIQEFEAKLNSLTVGIEVWMNPRGVVNEWTVKELSEEDGEFTVTRWVSLLGYTRLGKEWRVALKTFLDDPENESWFVDNGDDPVPVLKATRSRRLKAITLFPDLLDAIVRESEKLLEEIEESKAKLQTKSVSLAELNLRWTELYHFADADPLKCSVCGKAGEKIYSPDIRKGEDDKWEALQKAYGVDPSEFVACGDCV